MKDIALKSDDIKNLKIIIEYLLESEQKHYEESIDFKELLDDNFSFILTKEFYNNPEINHIYAITRRLKDSINL